MCFTPITAATTSGLGLLSSEFAGIVDEELLLGRWGCVNKTPYYPCFYLFLIAPGKQQLNIST